MSNFFIVKGVMTGKGSKIAVIGAGAAGLTAAYLLDSGNRVTIFEKGESAGGHIRTMVVPEGANALTPVDMGFMVYRERDSPMFTLILNRLGLKGRPAEMSVSLSNASRQTVYRHPIFPGLFCQGKNLLRGASYRMIWEILRFKRKATADLKGGRLKGLSVKEYLEKNRYSELFTEGYLLPLAALAWFVPDGDILECSADIFVRFLRRFGLFNDRHLSEMRIIPGGSHCYANAILNRFKGEIRLRTEVESVRRTDEKVIVAEKRGFDNLFDYVVIATHADEALRLLSDPTYEEKTLLGAWTYTRRKAVLHMDESFMPPVRRAWSSWNCVYDPSKPKPESLELTCYMNRLQRLKTKHPYFVTFQAARSVADGKIISETDYRCPVFSSEALRAQRELEKLNDPDGRTYFCGSYFGTGFHEDAVRSAFTALKTFCVMA